jgi:hypothetical protein
VLDLPHFWQISDFEVGHARRPFWKLLGLPVVERSCTAPSPESMFSGRDGRVEISGVLFCSKPGMARQWTLHHRVFKFARMRVQKGPAAHFLRMQGCLGRASLHIF